MLLQHARNYAQYYALLIAALLHLFVFSGRLGLNHNYRIMIRILQKM